MKLGLVWIPALLLLVGGCTARNPSPLDLRERLWTDANQVFEQHGAVLAEEARGSLRDFIEQGVATLEATHASETDVQAAEKAVRSLAEDVVAQAERHSSGRGVIEVLKKDVQAIRNKVCPLFPFCK